MTTARIRMPVTHAIVEMIDEMSADDRQAIRIAAAESISTVESAPRTGWLPLGLQLDILATVDRRLGRLAYYEFCQRHFMRTIDTPLVRSVFDGATRLFGMGPVAVFKVFRRSWSMMSSDAGEIRLVKLAADDLRIEIDALPLAEPRADLFVEGFAATFTGVFKLFDLDGQVELERLDPQRGSASYTGGWTPASA